MDAPGVGNSSCWIRVNNSLDLVIICSSFLMIILGDKHLGTKQFIFVVLLFQRSSSGNS